MGKRAPLAERFWDKVEKTDGCWEWAGPKDHGGYGKIGAGGRPPKTLRTHRVSFELHSGPIPGGLCVLHRCDNPPCVNPAHLFLGTHKDNIADKIKKGRNNPPSGARHHWAKLTAEQVAEIRAMVGPQRSIAEKYGVSQSAISSIRRGRVWKIMESKL